METRDFKLDFLKFLSQSDRPPPNGSVHKKTNNLQMRLFGSGMLLTGLLINVMVGRLDQLRLDLLILMVLMQMLLDNLLGGHVQSGPPRHPHLHRLPYLMGRQRLRLGHGRQGCRYSGHRWRRYNLQKQ